MSRERVACVLMMPDFKPGDLPPEEGYLEWHEWAEVQRKAGIKQSVCTNCGNWRTPQEKCCNGAPRLSPREYNAEIRRIDRAVREAWYQRAKANRPSPR